MQPISDVIKSLCHCRKVRMDPDYFLPPAKEVCKGYIFTGVHLSTRIGVSVSGGLWPGVISFQVDSLLRRPPVTATCGRYASYLNTFLFLKLWLNFVHNRHFVTAQLKTNEMFPIRYMFLTQTKWRRNIEIAISYRSSIQSDGNCDEHRNSREISQQQTNISKLQCYMYYEWQSIKYFY